MGMLESSTYRWGAGQSSGFPFVSLTNTRVCYSKNAPHLESAITLGVFVQMFATANCSGGTPQKVSNNILLDPTRKTIFRSTGEIGVRKNLH